MVAWTSILAGRGQHPRHRRFVRRDGRIDGPLNQRDLRSALDLAHRMEERRGVAELHFRVAPAQVVGEPLLVRQRGAARAILEDQPDLGASAPHRREKRRHAGSRVVAQRHRPAAPSSSLKQRVDKRVDLPRRGHFRDAGRCGHVFLRGNLAGPCLGGGIAIA